MRKKMLFGDSGVFEIETALMFVPFVILTAIIISLVKISVLQARVHYALTQTVEMLSMYMYTLEVAGAAEHIMKADGSAEAFREKVNGVKKDINEFIDGLGSLNIEQSYSAGSSLYDTSSVFKADPKGLISNLIIYGLSEGGSAVFEHIVRPIIGSYLTNGGTDGDAYLTSENVVGGLKLLEFHEFTLLDIGDTSSHSSKLLTSKGEIVIVCDYEVDIYRNILPFPISTISVTQYVKTKAWLNGRGLGYANG